MTSIEELTSILAQLIQEANSAFTQTESEPVLNQVKANYLGKKGKVTAQMKRIREVEPKERRAFGQAVNKAKIAVEKRLEQRKQEIRAERREKELQNTYQDLTLPAFSGDKGHLHPIRRIEEDMLQIFRGMGYAIAFGPQVETDFHNFEALNFPHDHPARDMQDTFVIKGDRKDVLRTHTSPVQIRTMLANKPPIRIAAPGPVFRCDTLDMTHSPCFHQVEGLVVDRGVTMSHLKGTLHEFAQRLFKQSVKIRLRPSFFPFTEPSVEVDVGCVFCKNGCRVCSHTGWIEILGAGMVDPNVLLAVGIDPEVFTGFAFGIGIERVAMLKYGIQDIRLFYENDQRFLARF